MKEDSNTDIKEIVESLVILATKEFNTDVIENPFSEESDYYCVYCKNKINPKVIQEGENPTYRLMCNCSFSTSIKNVVEMYQESIEDMNKKIKDIQMISFRKGFDVYKDLYKDFIKERERRDRKIDEEILNLDPSIIWE